MDNVFSRVKEAVAPNAKAILARYGIKHARSEKELTAQWTTGFLCPFCADQGGSASLTPQLYLKCHQCDTKLDVFDWVAKVAHVTPWEACKQLADLCSVPWNDHSKTSRKVVSGRHMPTRMMEDTLQVAVHDLWEHADAAPARKILEDRGLADPRVLTAAGVGWIKGWIVFARRDESGRLDERYRGWSPNDPKIKWRWFGEGTGGPGIWPGTPAPENYKILFCEGESDTLTAIIGMRAAELGYHVATWTAGATSCPPASAIPRSWHGREIHIAYDNDVFQGPNYNDYVVVTKPGKNPSQARDAARQRLRMLLEKIAPLFSTLGCKVVIRQCPVPPGENYGGDLRDWWKAGGRDFEADWKAFPFHTLPTLASTITDVAFDDVFSTLGVPIRTTMQVDAIGSDDVNIPRLVRMECDLGQHQACASCPGYRRFPDGIIDMEEFQRERAVAVQSEFPNEFIARHVVQRPRSCPRLEIVTIKNDTGSEWAGARPSNTEGTATRTMRVVSEVPPSLSGDVQVTGTVYTDVSGKRSILYANHVESLDAVDVDLTAHHHDFIQNAAPFANTVKEIDDYLDRRWRDLAYNVTRIHGRRDVQVASDLVAHSVMHFVMERNKHRGWLDVCIYGETRSGKSLTFRRMWAHHRLGQAVTAVSNVSRPGLVMGGSSDGMCKPGAFPRNNRKMFLVDEFHFLVQNALKGGEHPMTWLQSARDEGKVSGVKIYGSRELPAAVRFVTIANWMRGRRRSFEFACEHVGALYGSPETLARLDFAVCVGPHPTQDTLDKADQFWTADRTRSLILRAWAQEEGQVEIDDEAQRFARAQCDAWKDDYDSETLPLYTPQEKAISLMRIAVAVANICYSHPPGKQHSVHVRKVHVEWAAQWMVHLWSESGYDQYSRRRTTAHVISDPIAAEAAILVGSCSAQADVAEVFLQSILEPFSMSDVPTMIGSDQLGAAKWVTRLLQHRIIERQREGMTAYGVRYIVTRGGALMIGNMLALAREKPEEWKARYNALVISPGGGLPRHLVPMTAARWEILDDDHPDRQAVS
jgi:hypothetical protein